MRVVTKKFNIKNELTHHQQIHLKNKLFKCNDCNDCSFETNFPHILVNHIKTKHTRQDLVKLINARTFINTIKTIKNYSQIN